MRPPPDTLHFRVVEMLSKITDAPDEFLTAASLSVVSVLLGKRVGTTYAGRKLPPNLWIVILGQSTRLRKTTTRAERPC